MTAERAAFTAFMRLRSQRLAARRTSSLTVMEPASTIDLNALSRTFRPALMAFFMRRLANTAEAEDMTQEVFVRLAANAPTDLRSPEAYLFQMAANLLRDRARRERVRADYRRRQAGWPDAEVDPLDPLRIATDREQLALLTAGLQELPERTRSIFVLYRLEHMEKRAIAEAFGLAVSSVDRHLTKALAHLMLRVRGGEP
jgi:RNA polymerase sigma factor (sigma-70 family)